MNIGISSAPVRIWRRKKKKSERKKHNNNHKSKFYEEFVTSFLSFLEMYQSTQRG
jgi:hypothetical protein